MRQVSISAPLTTDCAPERRNFAQANSPGAKKESRRAASEFCAELPARPLPCPIAFPHFLSYARRMDLLTHDELARLTPPERLTLISQLWDSLEDDQLPLTAAQRAELDRRLETLDQDRREGITWTALKTELEQRCP
jgi:putative addiction module component (TIGR02574 family)